MKTKKMTRSQFLGTSLGIPFISLSGIYKDHFINPDKESFQMNDMILSDREAGLKYLKPTKKDLEQNR
jgi:hypothetical protein